MLIEASIIYTSGIDYIFKVILTGPGAVGKTSLVNRYITNTFVKNYKITIGVDFMSKTLKINQNKIAKMTIWDIGGQERFKFLRQSFYEGSHGALLVFDLTRAVTFHEMKSWLLELQQSAGIKTPFVLIGNKADLIKDIGECVDSNEVRMFAEQYNSIYIETSAKSGDNVENAFLQLAYLMMNRQR
ncbi:MAG: GTP-binding protein [Candidatus Lokiarchaeota archaeon]|nr:GTP-binding protein [Candidatus Lokiarchaeota archaeon]